MKSNVKVSLLMISLILLMTGVAANYEKLTSGSIKPSVRINPEKLQILRGSDIVCPVVGKITQEPESCCDDSSDHEDCDMEGTDQGGEFNETPEAVHPDMDANSDGD